MTLFLKILLSALAVCALAFVIWCVGVFMDGRKERRRVKEWQRDIARQERTFNEKDNETKTALEYDGGRGPKWLPDGRPAIPKTPDPNL